MNSVEQSIQNLLTEAFEPHFLRVDNDSYLHRTPAAESHFKVTLCSVRFSALRRVERHRMVYAALRDVMPRIHALQLHTFTPQEWEGQSGIPASSRCSHSKQNRS